MTRYKFKCRSCKFECISSIGREIGLHSSKVVMVCKFCSIINTYTLAQQGGINTEISKLQVCLSCHSSGYLSQWDGLTCPHCKLHMRAIGNPIGTKRFCKYCQR